MKRGGSRAQLRPGPDRHQGPGCAAGALSCPLPFSFCLSPSPPLPPKPTCREPDFLGKPQLCSARFPFGGECPRPNTSSESSFLPPTALCQPGPEDLWPSMQSRAPVSAQALCWEHSPLRPQAVLRPNDVLFIITHILQKGEMETGRGEATNPRPVAP